MEIVYKKFVSQTQFSLKLKFIFKKVFWQKNIQEDFVKTNKILQDKVNMHLFIDLQDKIVYRFPNPTRNDLRKVKYLYLVLILFYMGYTTGGQYN